MLEIHINTCPGNQRVIYIIPILFSRYFLGLFPLCMHCLLCFVPVNCSTLRPFPISSLSAAASWEAPPGDLRWLGLETCLLAHCSFRFQSSTSSIFPVRLRVVDNFPLLLVPGAYLNSDHISVNKPFLKLS